MGVNVRLTKKQAISLLELVAWVDELRPLLWRDHFDGHDLVSLRKAALRIGTELAESIRDEGARKDILEMIERLGLIRLPTEPARVRRVRQP